MDTPRRYHTIDAIRGVAVISMVLYHLYYDIFCLFGGHTEYCWLTPIYLWERSICITFIVISGVSLNFSRHGYRRGLIVAGCAMVVTLVTYVMYPDEAIWFGVLHLLSFSMLLTTALRPLLDKIKPIIGVIVFFCALSYLIPRFIDRLDAARESRRRARRIAKEKKAKAKQEAKAGKGKKGGSDVI